VTEVLLAGGVDPTIGTVSFALIYPFNLQPESSHCYFYQILCIVFYRADGRIHASRQQHFGHTVKVAQTRRSERRAPANLKQKIKKENSMHRWSRLTKRFYS